MFHDIEPEFGTSEWCRYALSYHLRTGRCSSVLIGQLVAGSWSRDLNFHAIVDEIGALDGSDHSRPTSTKPAKPFERGRLKGLMHKHFFQPNHLMRNVMDHLFAHKRDRSPKLDKLLRKVIADAQILPDRKIDHVLHKFVIGGYENRSCERRLTGEWIVYQPYKGMNYYLTLVSHAEKEEEIIDRIDDCLTEFPELTSLLHLKG